MDLNCKDQKIEELFGSTEYYFDFYQREYKWNKDTIEFLLDDIFFNFENDYNIDKENIEPKKENIDKFSWYYLNTYVTNEQSGKKYIVDGQQRLTTLALILIKLYHLAEDNKLQEFKIENLKRKLYLPSSDGYSFWMGCNNRNETLIDIFTNRCQSKDEIEDDISIKNLYKSYEIISSYLNNKLDTPHKIDCFILYFLRKILLVEIAIPTPEDVAMVFEVINARGEKLKAYEILKGELLGQIKKTELDEYLDIWNRKIQLLQINESKLDKVVDDFFIVFFRSRYARNTSDIKDFDKDYHKTIFSKKWSERLELKVKNNAKKVKDFIKNDFSYYCKIYNDIYNDRNHGAKYLYVYFNFLNGLGSQFLPLLSSLELNLKKSKIEEKIDLVSKLYDRHYSLLQLLGCYESNKFNEAIESLMIEIRDKENKTIKEYFDKRLIEDINNAKNSNISNPFSYTYFKNSSYGQYYFTRYFFARIDRFIAEEIGEEYPETYYDMVKNNGYLNGYDIEHILPYNEENEEMFEDEDDFGIARNKLGALVLLNNSVNRSSGAETYKDKLKTYANNGTLWAKTLTKGYYHKTNIHFRRFCEKYHLDFEPVNDFNEDAIEKRQKLLFKIVKILWSDKYLFGNSYK